MLTNQKKNTPRKTVESSSGLAAPHAALLHPLIETYSEEAKEFINELLLTFMESEGLEMMTPAQRRRLLFFILSLIDFLDIITSQTP